MTWRTYEADLDRNLTDLHSRVHRGTYRALPSRRTYIPKADGRQRPLAVAALEDKIVQRATAAVLSCIYEEEFLGRERRPPAGGWSAAPSVERPHALAAPRPHGASQSIKQHLTAKQLQAKAAREACGRPGLRKDFQPHASKARRKPSLPPLASAVSNCSSGTSASRSQS